MNGRIANFIPAAPASPGSLLQEECRFWLFRRDRRLALTLRFTGGLSSVTVPSPLLARLIATCDIGYLFMAHGHPSGDPRPSERDIHATRAIWRLARSLGASLQDHYILGRSGHFSFRESGLL